MGKRLPRFDRKLKPSWRLSTPTLSGFNQGQFVKRLLHFDKREFFHVSLKATFKESPSTTADFDFWHPSQKRLVGKYLIF